MQGRVPESFHVVTPVRIERYRFVEFAVSSRLVKARLLGFIARELAQGEVEAAAMYPEPCEHCDLCRWQARCERRRRADDHLSFVAGLSQIQQIELEGRGVGTLAALGALPTPIEFMPSRGSAATYDRLRHQASSRSASVRPGRRRSIAAGRNGRRFPPLARAESRRPVLDLKAIPSRARAAVSLFGLLGPDVPPAPLLNPSRHQEGKGSCPLVRHRLRAPPTRPTGHLTTPRSARHSSASSIES